MAEDLMEFDNYDPSAIPDEIIKKYGKDGDKVHYKWEYNVDPFISMTLNTRYKGIGYQIARWPDSIIKERDLKDSAVKYKDMVLLVGDIILLKVEQAMAKKRRDLKFKQMKTELKESIKKGIPKCEVLSSIQISKGKPLPDKDYI